ncbi:hypothetical protein FACS1894101_0010 [Betaproteobacteria bacterium]|nr:hypothetical protein FACS1894101_0010 [Betaproteobacteria bacterium]
MAAGSAGLSIILLIYCAGRTQAAGFRPTLRPVSTLDTPLNTRRTLTTGGTGMALAAPVNRRPDTQAP